MAEYFYFFTKVAKFCQIWSHYLPHQKSFGDPNHVNGVKTTTTINIQRQMPNLPVKSLAKFEMSRMKTHALPYNVAMMQAVDQSRSLPI